MKKVTNRSVLQWMKVFHLILISIWLGSVVCVAVLLTTAFFQWDELQFLTMVPVIISIYPNVILPVGILTILQGICYGLFTNWGFFKFRWIQIKWILFVFTGLCTGLGTIRHTFRLLEAIPQGGFQGGWADGNIILLFTFGQIVFLLTMVFFSVFKARKRKDTSAK